MVKRFWEIDFLRGIAIILMVVFHLLWDVNYYYGVNVVLSEGFWKCFQLLTASLFLFIVGVSLTLSYKKNKDFVKFFKRGVRIFVLGLAVTFVTLFVFPDDFVVFGVLHLIGLSIIISYPLLGFKWFNFFLGILIIILGDLIKYYPIGHSWFLIFGFVPFDFSSIDYFPLLPWFGIVLLGVFVGNVFYSSGKRNFNLKFKGRKLSFICFLGRNSLIIYLLHQLVLFGVFYVVNLVV